MSVFSAEYVRFLCDRAADATPTESIRYAFRRDLVVLYLVTWVGLRVLDFSRWFLPPAGRSPIDTLLSLPFTLLGLGLFVGGVVGVVHNILTDLLRAR